MTNSIKISPQRTSFILSVSVILYWATDSYLYLSCHINLMEYSTPVILYITAMILVCGVLQRFFFQFITKNELSLSFGKQVRPLPEQIKEIDPEYPKDKDISPGNLVVKHDYMDNYEVRVAEIEREKAERQADIKRVIHEYTTFVMTEFLSKENLEILHENIEYFVHGQFDLYKPIRSKVDNSLRSIDLMHFVWNIGERLGISLIDRATFIHTIFPHELKDASIKYLSKNLRTCGVCKIALDIPKTGDYHFKCMKNDPESDLDSTN
ncbi:MAG: hypothetical protein ACI3ZC_05390 [Candidatus Cryptobacteroides sp.]